MPDQITSIRLERFRKFPNNNLPVGQHNILVGPNNSGKTTILHALRLFFRSVPGEFSGRARAVAFHKRYISIGEILPVADSEELWTDRRKGNTKATGVVIGIGFSSGLQIDAFFTHRFGQVHVDAEVPENPNNLTGRQINEVIDHKLAFIPGLVGILPQEPYVTPARRSAMSIEARYSEMYRSSLVHLSETDKRALKSINSTLRQHLGVEIGSIQFDPGKDVYVDIEYIQNGVHLDMANAGSGMLQIIQLLGYIYLYKPTLLLIDEPDAHLHPELQAKLGAILKSATDEMGAQLFVATHAPDVIDAFAPGEVFFIDSGKRNLLPLKGDNEYVQGLIDAGIITNSALARIAVRPRCLVVEDERLSTMRSIDSILGTNLFKSAGDFKKAKGVSKFPTINEVYLTVQDVVGKKITMYFIQDRDGLPDRYTNYIVDRYGQKNLDVRILARHEIENYLLDGKILRVALAGKGVAVSLRDCRHVLVRAAETIRADTRGDIRRKCKQVNSFCERPEGLDDNAVEADVDQWFDNLPTNEDMVLRVFPGKELLKAVRNIIQIDYGVDVREGDLRAALTRNRLANDIKAIFAAIAQDKNQ